MKTCDSKYWGFPTVENNEYKNGAKIAFQQDGNIQIHSLICDYQSSHTGICDTNTHTHELCTQPVMSTGLLSYLIDVTQSLHAGLLKL